MEHITLYYREGPSDKVYQVTLHPKDDGYVVDFDYGRRGSTLTTGTKTRSPVDHSKAKSIFDKLVQEKTAKGYTPGESGTPYQRTAQERQVSDIQPQLLNAVEEHQVNDLINDPDYYMQEKMDGRRLLIRKQKGEVTGINRQGLLVSLPEPLITEASACAVDFLMDGEAIGDHLHAFDLLFLGDEDIRGNRYAERYLHLMNLLASFQHRHITMVPSQFTAPDKRAHHVLLQKRHAEGVVFKHRDAPYTGGRPASGGPALKFKFYETASFLVSRINEQRSVNLSLLRDTQTVPAGNVTIPPNHAVPSQGDIVEVRYLYAFPESGCVYQPVYLGRRDDIERSACHVGQLKFKAAA
ncbi:MAG: WGR domain-containing protein [Verrucomicrobiae bacterium]|nr:WGR domain-containing protein [Verrucomicrobiae bacterium]